MKVGFAVAVPGLFFLLLEAGLHLAGTGRDTDFFIPDDQPGIYRTNPRYTELFFPASFGLKPVNFRLPKSKPAGSFRVFVLGESAAMGVPEPGFGLAPQLRAQLRAAYPDKQIEVYNLGITAINSHVIRHIASQAVQFQPDLLVLYLGNNEVVGPYGPGSAVTDTMLPLPLIHAGIWIRSTRTGQLVQRALRALRPDFKEWRGMETFTDKTVRADDPRMETVYGNFSRNLTDIIASARSAGVGVLVSTVAVNVKDSAPFASRHTGSLPAASLPGWQRAVDQAGVALEFGDFAAARAAYEQALKIDPVYAETHFQLAKVLEEAGDATAARDHYLKALQGDALRFRADERVNQFVRTVASAESGTVTLVDAARALGTAADSTAAPAGRQWFFEHVHFNWDGNYALARLLAPEAGKILFHADPSSTAWLSPAACAEAVGYTDVGRMMMLMRMDELTARPPFTNQSGFAVDRTRLKQEIGAANDLLASRAAWQTAVEKIEHTSRDTDPANAFLIFHAAAVNLQAGNVSRALELNDRLSAMEPPSPERAAQRAFALLELKRNREAEDVLLQSAATDPYYFQTYGLLGSLWATTGDTAKGLKYLGSLVARMPESAGVRLTYAQLFSASGNHPAAEQQWREVLRLIPDDEVALTALVQHLLEQKKPEEALALMLQAQAYNPRNFANNARLEQIFEDRGDLANTIKYMQAMADSGPVRAALHVDLAANLEKAGRPEEMRLELVRARKAAAAESNGELLNKVDGLIRQHGLGAR